MSPNTETLFESVRALPEDEQVELVDAVVAALDESNPNPLDAAWMAEIQRRSTAYDEGRSAPIPWEVVKQRLRQRSAAGA